MDLRSSSDYFDDVPTRSPDVMLFVGRPFTAAEALSVGISAKALRRLVREGTVRRLMAGVYVDSAAEETPTLRAQALFEVVDECTIVCDRSAAWVHGVEVLGAEGQSIVPPLEVYRTGGKNRRRRRQCKGGKRTLAESDVQQVAGLAVTTPLRTALDLGRLRRREEAIGAIDALLRAGRLTMADLRAELPRFRGARGVVQLRQLVAFADPRAESMAESKLRIQLHDDGLPPPEVQWKIRGPRGVVRYRIDLAYPDLKLAIEYDGRDHHTSTADRARDARRREHLRRLGWTVLVLTAGDVYGPDPKAARKVWRARHQLTSGS